jgi:hypothetical protein
LLWEMHRLRKVHAVTWVEKKKLVVLVSTCTRLITREKERQRESYCTKYIDGIQVLTSPVHLEYTTFMRGVDVADQCNYGGSKHVRFGPTNCGRRFFFA